MFRGRNIAEEIKAVIWENEAQTGGDWGEEGWKRDIISKKWKERKARQLAMEMKIKKQASYFLNED